jgi:prolyl-tRNA editing enzyme YbaK/EbsC (Cys-tRNA(Pro) deacylase)
MPATPALTRLRAVLDAHQCAYELIAHSEPIRSTADATRYFDLERAVPALVACTAGGPVALLVSARRGRLDLNAVGAEAAVGGLRMATRAEVRAATGHEPGAIPLIGHGLPCVFDDDLLAFDRVYGGSGDPLHTLAIAPADLRRLNAVVGTIGVTGSAGERAP